ncbi:MAG: hemolysin III family protein [Pyrinomonadaceae bacterium]|nr:hemolysin III family protein [Pyrinomonadaceae bacterium]
MIRTRIQKTTVEELANTVTHGFGLLLSLVGFAFLLYLALVNGGFWHITSSIVYGLSLVTLYAASTFYHGALDPKYKKTLQIVDHCCIYLLIAGTYTPFSLVVLRGTHGQGLFLLIWSFAFAGILIKLFFGKRFMVLSVISYLVMGWLGVFSVQPLFEALGFAPIALVVSGGIAYSLGVIFFSINRIPHHHAIWHLFVLTGSILHFAAIALYVLPYTVKI